MIGTQQAVANCHPSVAQAKPPDHAKNERRPGGARQRENASPPRGKLRGLSIRLAGDSGCRAGDSESIQSGGGDARTRPGTT